MSITIFFLGGGAIWQKITCLDKGDNDLGSKMFVCGYFIYNEEFSL